MKTNKRITHQQPVGRRQSAGGRQSDCPLPATYRRRSRTHYTVCLTLLLLLLALAVPAAAQTITVKIFGFDASKFPQVRAFVSVTDAAGKAITLLKTESFKVMEDGRAAQIVALNVSDEAIYVGLVIDRSGSMNEQNKLRDALAAARAFVNEMRAQDEAFVTMFDDTTTPLVDFTSDRAALLSALGRITSGGGTAFYDATYVSAEKFKARQDKVKKALILLTDGLDNRSRHSLDAAIARAREFKVAVYTIGLGSDADQTRLKRLAEQTGGQFFFAPSGEDLKRLYLLIAEQLQKDYAIDFNSPRALADGTRRTVRITVTLPDGHTQTVEGVYVAGFLFNRLYANWVIGALIGVLLVTMGVAPSVVRLMWRAVSASASPSATPAPMPPVAAGAVCPRCQQPVRVGARFCPHCAQPLGAAPPPAPPTPPAAPAPLCPQCGKPVRAGARFCGNCRYRLS